jgi:hypothetical protein
VFASLACQRRAGRVVRARPRVKRRPDIVSPDDVAPDQSHLFC